LNKYPLQIKIFEASSLIYLYKNQEVDGKVKSSICKARES
jgi:hypothetical protein